VKKKYFYHLFNRDNPRQGFKAQDGSKAYGVIMLAGGICMQAFTELNQALKSRVPEIGMHGSARGYLLANSVRR
jgi:hypothetical protein